MNPISFKSGVKIRERDILVDDIQFWPGYGVVAPSYITTNGDANMLRANLHPDELDEFDAWLKTIPYVAKGT